MTVSRVPSSIARRAVRRAACIALAASAATTAGAQVRISQIYGGGGDLGAQFQSDFIELYNAGGSPVSLSGWSVQYASAAGSTWQVTVLPAVSIGAGQYLLVREADGTTLSGGQALALPTADVVGVINLSANTGKVALVNVTTALTGANPTAAAIEDFVGYGKSANWREPFGGGTSADNAPIANVDAAIYRVRCGVTDSNSNSDDFAPGYPSPRNTSVAANNGVSAIGMAQPYFAEPLQSLRLIVTPFDCDTLQLDANTTVTVDLTAIGRAASVPMVDDGTNGDEIAGDGIYSLDVMVANNTPLGGRHLPFTVVAGALSGGGLVGLSVVAASTPDNDNCLRATSIALPSSTLGDFTGACVEYNPVFDFSASPGPQSMMGARRGLWYAVVGNGKVLKAETCDLGSTDDTVIAVFDGTPEGLGAIAFNDDNVTECGSGSYLSSVSWCSTLNTTYYVWVGPWTTGAQTFDFTLELIDTGVSCTNPSAPVSCALAAVPTESEPAFGPASNDGCDSTPSLFTDIASPSTSSATLNGSARAYGFMRDVDWYRFQAGATGYVSASLTANFGGIVELFELPSNSCAGKVLLAQSPQSARCVQTTLPDTLITAGGWYALRVVPLQNIAIAATTNAFGGVSVGGRANFYTLDVALGDPPNDVCAQAVSLTLGAAAIAGTTLGATHDTASACDATGNDVWYSVTTTSAGSLHIDTCGSAIDTVLTAYGSCGGAALGCNDDATGTPCVGPASSLTLAGVAAGTYRIRVSDKGTSGNFVIKASLTLDNDDCASATAIAIPSTVSGSTLGATFDAGLPVCAGPGVSDAGGNTSITAPGVWFTVTSASAQTIYADTLSASYDTKLSVYTGTCGALSCVTMNDDAQPSYRSKVAWVAAQGQTYRIFVHGFGASTGDFTLNVTSAATPTNDSCATPITLLGGAGSQAGTNAGATGAVAQSTSDVLASCASDFTYWDTWYAWTAPCTTSVTITTCGSFDTLASVHSSCPTPTSGEQVIGACSDNAEPGCTPGSRITFDVDGGTTYLIRVATAGALTANAGGGAPYTLTWEILDTDLDGVADCFDGCPNDAAKIAAGVCGCGVADTDSDGDGTPNCIDGCPTDPGKIAAGVCGCGVADTDGDGDGTPNCIDGCPGDATKIAPGICGCGVADIDTDNDGLADCLDGCPFDPLKATPGACGCGTPDIDTDSDGTADCIDACPLDGNKTTPGICGCGTADTDTDGDTIADCLDNCDAIANVNQEDCDGDSIGDVCELANGQAVDTDFNGIPDNCQFGAVINYCTAGTSTNNCVATISAVGTPSVAATSGFTLIASQVEGAKSGLIFYGITGTHAGHWSPLSTSYLCVKSPTQRTPAGNSSGGANTCNGSLSVDFLDYITAHPGALGVPFSAGEVVWAQAWYRDPPAPKTTNLSNGLQFTLAP